MLLNELNNWCTLWRLKVNETKTKIIHFRPVRTCQTEFEFKYGGMVIDKVDEYKYLGVILDENLTFNNCSKALAASGGRALGALIAKFKGLKMLLKPHRKLGIVVQT